VIRSEKCIYLLLVPILFLTTSCLKEKQLAGQTPTSSSNSTYQGCTTGSALDASRVSVGFSFPDDATQIQIYRNGTLVYSTNVRSDSSYIDMGLMEGATYRYTCQMTDSRNRSVQGLNSLTLTTISTNPPTFTGIKTASASGSSAVAVTWNIPSATGVAAAKYKFMAIQGPLWIGMQHL